MSQVIPDFIDTVQDILVADATLLAQGITKKRIYRRYLPQIKDPKYPCITLAYEIEQTDVGTNIDLICLYVQMYAQTFEDAYTMQMTVQNLLHRFTCSNTTLIVYKCFNQGGPTVPYFDKELNHWESSLEFSVAVGDGNATGVPASGSVVAEALNMVLDDLTDVTAPNPTDGQGLVWDEATEQWIPGNPTAAAPALDDLTDVTAPTPTDGQALVWDDDTNQWIAATISISQALDDLTDVTAPAPTDGQALVWDDDTSQWIPGSPSTVGLSETFTFYGMREQSWEALDHGVGGSITYALTTFDDGGGTALYAGGEFITAGIVDANRVAKWDGTDWTALDVGLNGTVRALVVFDDGTGDALYAAGEFTLAGGGAAAKIAKWNGTTWSALGTGLNGTVHALAVYDDGTGDALYAGGEFTTAGGGAALRIAKWNGTTWSGINTTMTGDKADPVVYALAVYGGALYVGGAYLTIDSITMNSIAKWDGTVWAALDGGLTGVAAGIAVVNSLVVFGGNLIVGGAFNTAGSTLESARSIAVWNGTAWSELGSVDGTVRALLVFDGDLFAANGGSIVGVPALGIIKWDGTTWAYIHDSPMFSIAVYNFAAFDDGGGSHLYIGGDFLLAKWLGPPILNTVVITNGLIQSWSQV